MKNIKTQEITLTALMAAVLCIIGPFVIPIGMVPMSLTNMIICLAVLLLNKKRATISVAIYLLIGFIGLPVFAGFTGGVGKLLGPTGGFLIGYLALSWISGMILEKNEKSKILALSIGTISLYIFGTIWLMLQSKLGFVTAISIGVLPFLVFDVLKIVVAVILNNSIKKRIRTDI